VTKGVRKLREQEAAAGKQIVIDRQKVMDEEEELAGGAVLDKQTYPLETLSRVS
jgi:hypothetical protein